MVFVIIICFSKLLRRNRLEKDSQKVQEKKLKLHSISMHVALKVCYCSDGLLKSVK